MINHSQLSVIEFKRMIKDGRIQLAGNQKLKIYGTLHCSSGKRMKKENRVFFSSEKEAIQNGLRPCGHCMREAYLEWKKVSYASKV